MRRISALLATGLMSTAALAAVAPAQAQTQPSLIGSVQLFNKSISYTDCNVVGLGLRTAGLADADTTRSQLVENVNASSSETSSKVSSMSSSETASETPNEGSSEGSSAQPIVRLATSPTVNAVADRALECGVVKADPATPVSSAIGTSSKLSSLSSLPKISDVTSLSS